MARRKRSAKNAPVTLQFSVQYAVPNDGRFKMSKKVLDEAIHWWIENEGEDPPGFKITPIAWVHGDKSSEADSVEDFIPVLRRLLQAGTPVRYTLRGNEGVFRS